ncbi:PLP-dependent transferase [Fistulina hepatica ATCC 64428]|uniref:PLP-dependent transferase n=1 Tax=Fistulina hepatica ATCC 64428 TaxID=1128425 RepID=A0A0D7AJ43_9AGAR|nr:PLP-dependent transferase [Fistulina hepatica ATCC 64428]
MSRAGYRFSRGILNTISPPIPQAHHWASCYKATADRPLLDMSQGVPGLSPPLSVQKALGEAASSPSSFGYALPFGEDSLREALALDMKHAYGPDADIAAADIALTSGCNLAFVAAIMTVADAGDEVVLTVPWYFNHQMLLSMLNMHMVVLQTRPEDGFMPSIARCRELITNRTKAVALVTPNNPTGAIYSPALIAEFAALAHEKGVALILDETYRDFITTGEPPHNLFSTSLSPVYWRSTLIHLYSFSKSYCLPGHRLGAIVAAPEMLEHLKGVLDTVQICAPRPIQLALAPLIPELRPFIKEMALAIKSRHDLFRRSLPSAWMIGAQGGYYAFVKHPFKDVTASQVCERLAKEMGVVTLPSAFFCEGKASDGTKVAESEEASKWIRFSVANISDKQVIRVCERLKESETLLGWSLE